MYRYHFDLDQDFQFRVPLEIHKILLRLDKCLVCQIICYDIFLTLHCKAGGELFYYIMKQYKFMNWRQYFLVFQEWAWVWEPGGWDQRRPPTVPGRPHDPRAASQRYLIILKLSLYLCRCVWLGLFKRNFQRMTYLNSWDLNVARGVTGTFMQHIMASMLKALLLNYNFVGIGSNWPYYVK